jgi:AcrR family transcriptional regulator
MSVKPRRAYNSPQREGQANATRRRILIVADEVFAERGFAAVTMETIARRAGVSLATVYLYFPGKAAVVAALADEVVAAADLSVEQVEGEPDPIRQLRIGAGIIRRLNERSWRVADVLRSAHGGDEGLASVWEVWQERHLAAIRRAIAALAAIGALREGFAPDEAVDAFYALTGTDVYRALVRERGWSADRYERWLFRISCAELLGFSPGDGPVEPAAP